MGVFDLNNVAVNMGKVLKLLSDLEPIIYNGDDVYLNKEELYLIAYVCRVGILDKIYKNSIDYATPVRIPTGLFRSRKETIQSALNITIGKLKEIASKDPFTSGCVEEILNKRCYFYIYEKILPEDFKQSL